MSTEEIKTQFGSLINLSKQGGVIGVISALFATILFYLQLSPEHVQRLKEAWFFILSPSVLVLIAWMWNTYLTTVKEGIKIQEGINANLLIFTNNFERLFEKIEKLFAHELDNKIYFDTEFTEIKDRLRTIFFAMEKRGDYKPGPDTEQFIAGS